MRSFMDFIQNAFCDASHWNLDNSYSSLTATARGLLLFDTPKGVRLHISSLASPNFATSYTVSSVGFLEGSLSYLYTSLPITRTAKSNELRLHYAIEGYRQLQELRRPDGGSTSVAGMQGAGSDRKDSLLYGRLFLPRSSLEALYMRRLSATKQLKISCVSDSGLHNGGTVLALLQQDVGKFSTEYLCSTDSALLGVRGLYNFGPDPRKEDEKSAGTTTSPAPGDQPHGRFSAGAELYYGLLNKSGGLSTGLRFVTLPTHAGFPYTMTLTLNPLMGNLSSTYAVQAGRNLAMCSQFDFNFYSYESDLRVGFELWKRRRPQQQHDVAWARKLLRPGWPAPPPLLPSEQQQQQQQPDEDVAGVLKARVDQHWRVGLLWEGRVKELLFSVGASLDLLKREQMFRGFGVEFQYSS